MSLVVLDDRGAGPVGHGPLDTRRDDLVLAADQVPGRDGPPGRGSEGSVSGPSVAARWEAKTTPLSGSLSPVANDANTVDRFRYKILQDQADAYRDLSSSLAHDA
jgi:hypothetical protein